jgi:hypothetical protein
MEEALQYRNDSVLFFGLRNPNGRYFLPTSTSTFGGLAVRLVLFDSGCGSVTLPFPTLGELQHLFGTADYSWTITEGASLSGTMLTLCIKRVIQRMIGRF